MKVKALLLTPLLTIIGLNAQPLTGTTLGHYSKPGAPINMTYISDPVNKNETTDVNITLTTTVRNGTMNVLVNLDKNLIEKSNVGKEISFEIIPNVKKYFINLKVSSTSDGLFYIRLLTKIDKGAGSKMRAFAVPVLIGKAPTKVKSLNLSRMKPDKNENISVSKAVETIRELK